MIKNPLTTYISFILAGICMMLLYTSGVASSGVLGFVEAMMIPLMGGLLAGVSAFALTVHLFNLPTKQTLI